MEIKRHLRVRALNRFFFYFKGWTAYKDLCIKFYPSDEGYDWDSGQAFCETLDANLVETTNEDRYTLIKHFYTDNHASEAKKTAIWVSKAFKHSNINIILIIDQ